MLLEYVLVAEGFGQDSRGALTLIAVDQVATVSATLPAAVSRFLVVRAVEDRVGELEPSTTLTIRFEVKSPSGRTVAAGSMAGKGGERQIPDIPAGIQLVLQVRFEAEEAGEYVVDVTLAPSVGLEVNARTQLYVISPPPTTS